MKKPLIIHTFLFAIFPVMSFFVKNIVEIVTIGLSLAFFKLSVIIVISIFFALILLLFFNLLFKNIHKSAIFTTIFIVMFFSYGHFNIIVKELSLKNIFESVSMKLPVFYFIFCLSLFTLLAYLLRQKKRIFFTLTRFLNIVSIILLCFSLLNIAVFFINKSKNDAILSKECSSQASSMPTKPEEAFPDIYYIILDAYSSEDTLKEYYNFNNHNFINYLKEKGFYVAEESTSNYAFTSLSLASSLNMEYLDDLARTMGEGSNDLSPVWSMIEKNKVASFLKSRGYNITNIRFSSWSDNFFLYFLKTVVPSASSSSRWLNEFDAKRKQELLQLDELKQIHRIDNKPNFIFAHILLPHGPYVFGPNGEAIEKDDGDGSNSDKYYIEQLIFTNKKAREIIDTIFSNSKASAVIILQGDHGRGNNKAARMRILNAYYLPQQKNSMLYNSVTPVNTFRIIFNAYFGVSYGLLKDRNYFSWWTDSEKPYRFIDVSDEVGYGRGEENIDKLYADAISNFYIDKVKDTAYNLKIVNGFSPAAVYFDGNSAYAKTSLELSALKGATIMFSVKPDAKQNTSIVAIIDNGHSAENDFVLQSVDVSKHEYTFHCFGVDSVFNLPAETWTHFLVSIDLSKNTFDVYLNGKKYSSSQIPLDSHFGSVPLTFAKLSKSNERYFRGTLDEVFIWPRALSKKEIKIITGNVK